MDARDYLERIEKQKQIIENKEIEVVQWKEIAKGSSSVVDGERVQSSGNPQKTANAVCIYVDIEKEIEEYKYQLICLMQEISRTIQQLPVIEYNTLHMVYIQGKTLEEVSERYGKSSSWAKEKHRKAIELLQVVLNGKPYKILKKDEEK